MIKNIFFDIGKVLVRFDWEDYLASFQFPEEETTAIAKAMFLSLNWNLVDEGRLSYEEIEQIFKESNNWATVAEKLGYSKFGGSSRDVIQTYADENNIDTSHFTGQG